MVKKVHVKCIFTQRGESLHDILRRSLILFLQCNLRQKGTGPGNPVERGLPK